MSGRKKYYKIYAVPGFVSLYFQSLAWWLTVTPTRQMLFAPLEGCLKPRAPEAAQLLTVINVQLSERTLAEHKEYTFVCGVH